VTTGSFHLRIIAPAIIDRAACLSSIAQTPRDR
jgi:hypothetical protein